MRQFWFHTYWYKSENCIFSKQFVSRWTYKISENAVRILSWFAYVLGGNCHEKRNEKLLLHRNERSSAFVQETTYQRNTPYFAVTENHTMRVNAEFMFMMTSSNGNILRVTGPLWSLVPGEFPAQRPVTRSFDVSLGLHMNKRLSNNREAGDLRRHHAHYDVSVMWFRRQSASIFAVIKRSEIRNMLCIFIALVS